MFAEWMETNQQKQTHENPNRHTGIVNVFRIDVNGA